MARTNEALESTKVKAAALPSPVAFRVEAEGRYGNFCGYKEGRIQPRNPRGGYVYYDPSIQNVILHMWGQERGSAFVSVTTSWAAANRMADQYRTRRCSQVFIYTIDLSGDYHHIYDAFKLAELFKCQGQRLEYHRHELLIHNGIESCFVRGKIPYGDTIETSNGKRAFVDFPIHPGFLRLPVSYFKKLEACDGPAVAAAAEACRHPNTPNCASALARFKYVLEQNISEMIWVHPGPDPLDEKRHYKLVSDIVDAMFVDEDIEVFAPSEHFSA